MVFFYQISEKSTQCSRHWLSSFPFRAQSRLRVLDFGSLPKGLPQVVALPLFSPLHFSNPIVLGRNFLKNLAVLIYKIGVFDVEHSDRLENFSKSDDCIPL